MLRKPSVAVAIVSTLLLLYCVFINTNRLLYLAYFIFAISPLLLIWLAYYIIRYGCYNGKELDEKEEWGYQDKNKDELWVL